MGDSHAVMAEEIARLRALIPSLPCCPDGFMDESCTAMMEALARAGKAERERDTLKTQHKKADQAIGDLLAVIHGDGGHHQSRVGLEVACVEARRIVLNARTGVALRDAKVAREKAEEENAHLSRELTESRGEEETSQTLAIYEGFKDALRPFGHEHLNVQARIEFLVAEWQKAERERDELLSRLHQEHMMQDSEKEKE